MSRTFVKADEDALLEYNFGWVVNRAVKSEFDKRVERFRGHVDAYAEGVRKKLEGHLEQTRERLMKILLPIVKEKPPAELKKYAFGGAPTDAQVRDFVLDKLDRIFGHPERIFSPKVKLVYKNVAYESFEDPEFIECLEACFGEDAVQTVLNEHDAAPERQPTLGIMD